MTVNRVLCDIDRTWLDGIIREMYDRVPEMSRRKIATAIVQQAFVVDIARHAFKKGCKVLNAGSWEDTAGELLKLDGYQVTDVDPTINSDLHNFKEVYLKPVEMYVDGIYTGQILPELFDGIISTSVLEHTINDEEFIADCCHLLADGGVAILTMDFKNDWQPGQRVPSTSNRFYRRSDLEIRLREILRANNCDLVSEPDYTQQDTFSWEGIPYSFATFVFKKDIINAESSM